MIAASQVVVENLLYVSGAVILAVIGGLIVTIRHRRPKSVEANMASFNRGLSVLAPSTDTAAAHRRRRQSPGTGRVAHTVQTVLPRPMSEAFQAYAEVEPSPVTESAANESSADESSADGSDAAESHGAEATAAEAVPTGAGGEQNHRNGPPSSPGSITAPVASASLLIPAAPSSAAHKPESTREPQAG